jgi:uracil-DNA glycosylase family 4
MTKLLYVKMDAFIPCDILVVGGQVTESDERLGLHFTGIPGNLVRHAFLNAGVYPTHISYTSLVKVRPEGDRKLTEDEAYSWLPSLLGDIVDTAPRHVVTFGKVAARAVRLLSDRICVPITCLRHPDVILKHLEYEEEWSRNISEIVSLCLTSRP